MLKNCDNQFKFGQFRYQIKNEPQDSLVNKYQQCNQARSQKFC